MKKKAAEKPASPFTNTASAVAEPAGVHQFADHRPEASRIAGQTGVIRSATVISQPAPTAQLKLMAPFSKTPVGLDYKYKGKSVGSYPGTYPEVMEQFHRSTYYAVDVTKALSYAEHADGFEKFLADKLAGTEEREGTEGKFGRVWQQAQDRYALMDIDWGSKYDELKTFYAKEKELVEQELSEVIEERDEVIDEDSESAQKAMYTRLINKLKKYGEFLDKGMNEANELREKALEFSWHLVHVIKNPERQRVRYSRHNDESSPPPGELKEHLQNIRIRLQTILDNWVGNAGQARSMSAKGRARDRSGTEKDFGTASTKAKSLFSLIKIDGATPDKVFEPDDDSYEAPGGVLTFGGVKLGNLSDKDSISDHLNSSKGEEDKDSVEKIAGNIDSLAKPKSQTVVYNGPAIKKDRGSGQAAAMLNTNAAAYAFAKGLIRKAVDTGDWEWLHIRAASLGGTTDSTNLVPGLSDANTLMMPVESHINELSKASGFMRRTTVTFAPESPVGGGGHVFRYISLDWEVERDPNPFAGETDAVISQKGEAKFDITQGRVVTKKDIELLEGHLKEKRKNI